MKVAPSPIPINLKLFETPILPTIVSKPITSSVKEMPLAGLAT